MALLDLTGVDALYGRVRALRGVTISVDQGEVVALIGSNGAGKTTTLRTIAGVLRPRKGTVRMGDRDLTKVPANEIVRLGLAHSPEGRRIFSRMSVKENLEMGAYARKDPPSELAKDFERVYELFPRLKERLTQRAGTLSGGEQQMVAMARALMGRPKLICMDEPTMGLSPLWVDRVLDLIAAINREGTTVFMVEQNASLALEIAHHAYVLQTGRIILDGPAADLRSDPRIRDAYLGGQEAA